MNNLPNHIAIILDGNGRWAQQQNLERTIGHREGARRIKDIALSAQKIGIKYLTLYCFSTENWKRPTPEVQYLMKLPERLLNHKEVENFRTENIRLNHIGRQDRLPNNTRQALEQAIDNTKNNTGLTLTFAFDYGFTEELINAIQQIRMLPLETVVDENLINSYLYTRDLPPVDLLIRPGGEKRLSNFLLWQCSYAELYFTEQFWPDFDENSLNLAINDYNNRNRRFGGLK